MAQESEKDPLDELLAQRQRELPEAEPAQRASDGPAVVHESIEPVNELPVINSAAYDFDGVSIMLEVWWPATLTVTPYALNATDMNGYSPYLRASLAERIAAGEIVVGPAPQMPEEDEALSEWKRKR